MEVVVPYEFNDLGPDNARVWMIITSYRGSPCTGVLDSPDVSDTTSMHDPETVTQHMGTLSHEDEKRT